jgi:hypothetical protein
MSAAAVIVYRIFLQMSGEAAYAQLAITYMLTSSGLALVILLRPPMRGLTLLGTSGDERSGDWRPTALVLVLLALVFVVASISLADQLFGLRPLQQPLDYVIILLAVPAWILAAGFLWSVAPLERLWQRFR